MKEMTKLEKLEKRLEENIQAAKYQMQFAGQRFGVLQRLKELDRERVKIEKQIAKLTVNPTN